LTHCDPYAERRVAIVKLQRFAIAAYLITSPARPGEGCAGADRGLEISRRRAAEEEAAAFAVRTNKAGFERDAADLTLYQRGTFSEHVRIRLVRQRPGIAGAEQRRGNAGGKQLDPIGGGVPDMADVVPPRRRLQPALDEAVYLPVIQLADDVSRRVLKTSGSAACADPPNTRPHNISAPPLPPVAEVATFPRVICHDQVSVAPSPLKQLLAIMLAFTVAIVLNSDVAWHRVVQ
jgi:hypothetical protein